MPRTSRRTLIASAVAVGLAATSIAWSTANAAPGRGAPSASGPVRNYIVLLRDQHTDLSVSRGIGSARVQAAQRDQAPLLASATRMGARDVHGFTLVNGFAAGMTAAQLNSIIQDPQVAGVFP